MALRYFAETQPVLVPISTNAHPPAIAVTFAVVPWVNLVTTPLFVLGPDRTLREEALVVTICPTVT